MRVLKLINVRPSLETNLKRIVWQVEGKIDNQILGVKGPLHPILGVKNYKKSDVDSEDYCY